MHHCLLLLLLLLGHAIGEEVLLSWTSIAVRFKKKHILTMGPGTVQRKRLLAVLGPSGSGKTTFLNSISGRLKASKNDVICKERNEALPQSEIVNRSSSSFSLFSITCTKLGFCLSRRQFLSYAVCVGNRESRLSFT